MSVDVELALIDNSGSSPELLPSHYLGGNHVRDIFRDMKICLPQENGIHEVSLSDAIKFVEKIIEEEVFYASRDELENTTSELRGYRMDNVEIYCFVVIE